MNKTKTYFLSGLVLTSLALPLHATTNHKLLKVAQQPVAQKLTAGKIGTVDVKLIDNTSSVTLQWNSVATTDVPASNIKYRIFNYNFSTTDFELLKEVDGTVTEYIVNDARIAADKQQTLAWIVTPVVDGVEKQDNMGFVYYIGGKPYATPFHRSFANYNDTDFDGYYISSDPLNGSDVWNLHKTFTYDNDNGSLRYMTAFYGEADCNLGKISVQGKRSPVLVFNYNGKGGMPASVKTILVHENGKEEEVWTLDFTQATTLTTDKWGQAVVKIPASFTNEKYFKLKFIAKADDDISSNPIFIDNINVIDPLEIDAAIAMTSPEKVQKGGKVAMNVEVKNNGANAMKGAKLKVTANGKIVYEQAIEGEVGVMSSINIPVSFDADVLPTTENINVIAEIIMEGDKDMTNNKVEKTIGYNAATLDAPTNLKAEGGKNAPVNLTWTAPKMQTVDTFDDFESYDAWATTMGNWTTENVDGGTFGDIDEVSYPHQGEKLAFMNWQPKGLLDNFAKVFPHSGKRAAVSIYHRKGSELPNADMWLISPRLSGKAQEISFFANDMKNSADKGVEVFDILYTTEDSPKDLTKFTQVGNTYSLDKFEWTEIKSQLPENAKYFAIHRKTDWTNAYVLTLDDVKYQAGVSAKTYNVYRDGELIGTTNKPNFTDDKAKADGEYTYSVIAVYDNGAQSDPVSTKVATGIEEIVSKADTTFNVYTISGTLVKRNTTSLSGLAKGIYIVNGKKVVVK